MRTSIIKILIFLSFAINFGQLLLANSHDWDQFYTKTEVERSSIVDYHELPLWSYQLCGGVTRIGDPESFSLSPLMIPVLVFGTFWGLKISILSLQLFGYFYLNKLLRLLKDKDNKGLSSLSKAFSLSFVFSNFFLWHTYLGHLTFSLSFLVIANLYYFLKALSGEFNKRDFLLNTLTTCTCFLGPFYHASLFFALPLVVVIAPASAFIFVKQQKLRKPIVLVSLSIVFGLFLSIFKIYNVANYQFQNPRTLGVNLETREQINITESLYQILVPTYKNSYLFSLGPKYKWGIHEYSVFSVTNILLLIALGAFLLRLNPSKVKSTRNKRDMTICLIFSLLIFSSLLFSIGHFSNFSPFGVLNLLLHDSIRVPARFQGALVLSISLAGFFLLERFLKETTKNKLSIAILLLCIINQLSFFEISSIEGFKYYLNLKSSQNIKMSVVSLAKEPSFKHWTFETVLKKEAVANCYVPLSKSTVTENYLRTNSKTDSNFIIQKSPSTPLKSSCIKNSYFSQNQLFIDDSCQKDFCITLNDINQEKIKEQFYFDKKLGLFCKSQQTDAQKPQNYQ